MNYFTLTFLFIAIQITAAMASDNLKYSTHYSDGNIEIRYYEEAVFARVTSEGSLFSGRNQHFSTLAGYIFGKNEAAEKIGMTSPVLMHEQSGNAVMQFVMPSRYDINNLPEPGDPSIRLIQSEGFWAVTIRYGGFNNASRFQENRDQLEAFIRNHQLPSTGELFGL